MTTFHFNQTKPQGGAHLSRSITIMHNTDQDQPKTKTINHEIFNDHFQNYKRHAIPKAQLVIADIPYNIGKIKNN